MLSINAWRRDRVLNYYSPSVRMSRERKGGFDTA
jgi:hypothetical protein